MGRTAIVGMTLCAVGASALMAAPASAQVLERASTVEKGSLIYFHKVEVIWDDTGQVVQDTFISITNDRNLGPINVQMYFINGDDPIYDDNGVVVEPGWNWTDQAIIMTKDQPAWWSAWTGNPGPQGAGSGAVAPWWTLDPDGRECPDNPEWRCVRGFIVGWVVDDNGEEVRWNHLKGEGTIVNYIDGYAWEYNTLNFKVVKDGTVDGDAPDGTPGQLLMDGDEYASAFDRLVLNFQASGSRAWGDPDLTEAPVPVESDTDLTLHPLSIDLRQNNDGPACTKADILVWNENETKMSGNHRCICCWDQTLMSVYHLPETSPPAVRTFLRDVLQTDHGKAVIDGHAANLCNVDFDPDDDLPLGDDPRDIVTEEYALVGVSARILQLDPNAGMRYAAAGSNIIGKGDQSATLIYTPDVGGNDEAEVVFPETPEEILNWLERNSGIQLENQQSKKSALR